MKAIPLLLMLSTLTFGDTTTTARASEDVPDEFSTPAFSRSDCDDELNRAKRFECYRALKKGYTPPLSYAAFEPPKWDTITTISIQGEDTTRTITIKRAEDWEKSKRDFTRFVNMYTLLGALNIFGTVILLIAASDN